MEENSDPLSAPSLSIIQCVTLKLSSSNYLLWKTQIESFLSSQSLLSFISGDSTRPAPTVVSRVADEAVETANPDFAKWIRKDQLVMAWLFGSLTEEALRSVYGLHSAHEVWVSLAKKYNRVSATRRLDLQRKMRGLSKKQKTMTEHLGEVKSVCDQLNSIDCPINDQEKIYGALSGLGREYESICTVIEHSMDSAPDMTFEDAAFKLVNFDDKLQVHNQAPEVSPHMAFATGRGYSSRGRGYYNNRGGGRGRNTGGSSNYSTCGRGFHQQFSGGNRPTCQICGKYGHTAASCYSRFDQEFQTPDNLHTAMNTMRLSDQAHNGNE